MLYSDGPVGPRQGRSAGLPIPLALAATFDPALAGEHGRVAASEARDKGNDVIFGPAVNIARVPLAGRTYENYGEDPFLQSRMVVPWIEAAQRTGVIADVKHFAANNQEGVDASAGLVTSQTPVGAGLEGNRMLSNDIVDERTLREIYLPHFEAAVREARVAPSCAPTTGSTASTPARTTTSCSRSSAANGASTVTSSPTTGRRTTRSRR
ncbi:hypothetical protein NBH00_15010 [Paraconexibacter antarcticus]|uniref:Glycoside hydrolase family 3 N-terminal domain-containing protein n=1 Tax=Paraconexibacter antarcticus TaxID=2949664 RepID=A0ABY5DPE2_9ACTN|nr:hypothetical protein NBH00_15010 [Paraconexibacter antarcticus]